jgi:hypothetical protein
MNTLCDLVLVFMVTSSTGARQQRKVYASYRDAIKIVDNVSNGTFVGFEAVKQFDCKTGPSKDQE